MMRGEERRRDASKPGTLLIVEGDPRLADKLASDFQSRGYAVECAESLSRVQECDLDGVGFAIVELWLRDGSGLDVISEIKRRSRKVRVVVLTSRGTIETAVQATKLGAADYLTKPVDSDAIERALLAD